MPSLHKERTHPGPDVDGCFGCHVSTITVAAVSGPVRELDQREKVLSQDMDAYKRMRRQGKQPAHLGGSAYVEKHARSDIEITHPRIIGLSDEARQHAAAAADIAPTIAPELSRFQDGGQ